MKEVITVAHTDRTLHDEKINEILKETKGIVTIIPHPPILIAGNQTQYTSSLLINHYEEQEDEPFFDDVDIRNMSN